MSGDYIGEPPEDGFFPGKVYRDQKPDDERDQAEFSGDPRLLFRGYVRAERYDGFNFAEKERDPQRGVPAITRELRRGRAK